MKLNLIIAGVGGQGILLASRVVGMLALQAGWDSKVAEVHGMSQRGGDVITHVRIGETVFSPIIEEGAADAVIAFEQMEAMRAMPFLKEGGLCVVGTQKIPSMPVLIGVARYPEGILDKLAENADVCSLDALSMAVSAGSARAVNMVLLGAFAGRQTPPKEQWLTAIAACVPANTVEINEKAFLAGWEMNGA
ncbi:MAG: indolepyruvate oxidoreductase subunit beta [Clostridia bacterium]|nr:indolepyruvate oxidoreductase subunit beta [Clostridia bacterium]